MSTRRARALGLHVHQLLVQDDHLARVCNGVLVRHVWCTQARTVEQVRMAGDLAELHNDVHQQRLALLLARQAVHSVDILLKHGPVPLALRFGLADIDVEIFFCERV